MLRFVTLERQRAAHSFSFCLLFFVFACFFHFPADSGAAPSDSNLLARAQEEFSRRQYEEAMLLFRKYLRKNPKDQDAWTRFAATYYHTGQANYALQYLLRAKSSNELRIFNMYYRALCYDALGEEQKAFKLLNRVIKSDAPLAEDALFEVAAIEFDRGNKDDAKDTARKYLRRYKNGRYRGSAEFILKNVEQAGKAEVAESQRAIYRSSYFKVHPFSLFPFPHGWVYQLGFEYVGGKSAEPRFGQPEVNFEEWEDFKLVARLGLNFGPFKRNWSSSNFGYLYSQDWASDRERVDTYVEDAFDLEYFPFRPDMLERTHRFYVDSFGTFGPFKLGAYGHYHLVRGGSALFPAPERPEVRQNFDIQNGSFLSPYVDWEMIPDHRLRFSLLMEKVFDLQQGDNSFKTYNFSTEGEDQFLSFTLEESSHWPDYNVKLGFEVFRLSTLYNDYWGGSTLFGGATRFEWEPYPSIRLSGKLGYGTRTFNSQTIKSSPCENFPSGTINPGDQVFACERNEKILKAEGSASFFASKHSALSISGGYEKIENDTLKVYDEEQLYFLARFTQSFPDLDTGAKYIEPPRGLFHSREPY